MSQDRQQDFLIAQLNKKRELKQRYLYQPEGAGSQDTPAAPENTTLGGLVMTNAILLAIKGRKDIYGTIGRLRAGARHPAPGGTLFDTALNWCAELAEAADCSVYELFIDDRPKRRRIIYGLLERLKEDACDSWEGIRIDPSGGASFELPHFDYLYRMTDQPRSEITLVFQKVEEPDGRFRYRLMIGDLSRKRPDDLIPDSAVLWDESDGALSAFTEAVIADLRGGWALQKEGFLRRREQLRGEAAKLKDLCAVLREAPEGLNFQALLQKEMRHLEQLRQEEREAWGHMPPALKQSQRGKNAEDCLLLLGGAIQSLERCTAALADPAREGPEKLLSEAVYLLENAGELI